MKKAIYTLSILFFTINTIAQVPNKMSYQTVVRNSSNQLVNNQQVGIKVSLLQGSATGNVVFTQIFTPTTNANGLATIVIGDTSAAYNSISWANGTFFIKSEIDPTGGTNYTITATSELMSVPYAMVAGSVAGLGRESVYVYDENYNNNEMDILIKSEVGVITQKIDIQNLSNVKNIDLNTVKLNKVLYSLNINTPLDSFKCDNVEKILNPNDGHSTFKIMSKYTSMKKLKKCSSIECSGLYFNSMLNLETTGNAILEGPDLNFPKLEYAGNIYLNGTNLNFPLLKISRNATLSVSGLNINFPMIDSAFEIGCIGNYISFPQLKYCDMFNCGLSNKYKLNSINLPSLNKINEFFIIRDRNGTDTLLSLPSLSATNAIFIYRDTGFKTIQMPSLKQSLSPYSQGIRIENNPDLETLKLDSLVLIDNININHNPKLANVILNSNINIVYTNNSSSFDLSYNAFNSATVNLFLAMFRRSNFSYARIDLRGQASPTGQGLIDKQILINQGFDVYTN